MNEKMKRQFKTIGSFLAVIAVSTAALWLMSLIAGRVGETTADSALHSRFGDVLRADSYEDITVAEGTYEGVRTAYRAVSEGEVTGYIIELTADGYGGDMEVIAAVSSDAERILGIKIGENNETENIGSKVTESSFLSQFSSSAAPFELSEVSLTDGTYFAEGTEFDSGYKDNVTITVSGGMITRAVWDAESESGGKSKRQASIDGEYVMTTDGLMWHEQAQLLESRLLELQSPSKLAYSDDGKTDAVAGVSIRITPFVSLAQKCIELAGGTKGTAIDAVSGATYSSRAVTEAANAAVSYVREYILTDNSGE